MTRQMVKSILYILLFHCFVVFIFNEPVSGKGLSTHEMKALSIVNRNAILLEGVDQLLVVFNETPESNSAIMVVIEKREKKWVVISPPLPAGIGRNGFAAPNVKREGDGRSPTGLFGLGQLFCYEKTVNTRMPYIQTTPEDKWIDDPDSPDYNRYIRGATSAKSFEKLLLSNNDYKYCLVIEYNMHPVIKGKGSAIFLHISEGDTVSSSSGCVVLLQKDMESLLKWMNPEMNPSILMGNEKMLVDGLKSVK